MQQQLSAIADISTESKDMTTPTDTGEGNEDDAAGEDPADDVLLRKSKRQERGESGE